MKDYLAIAIGGILGAVARFGINRLTQNVLLMGLPTATLIVNVIGSFGLAYFLQKAMSRWALASHWRLGIATGFFGAFTTFSTFMLENVAFIINSDYPLAFTYLFLTALFAGIAGWAGWSLAERENSETLSKEKEQ